MIKDLEVINSHVKNINFWESFDRKITTKERERLKLIKKQKIMDSTDAPLAVKQES